MKTQAPPPIQSNAFQNERKKVIQWASPVYFISQFMILLLIIIFSYHIFYSFQNIQNYLIFSAHIIVSCISLMLSFILKDTKPFFKTLPGMYSTWFALSILICGMTSLQSHWLSKLSKLLMILSVSQFHLVWTSHHNHAVTLLNILSFLSDILSRKVLQLFLFCLFSSHKSCPTYPYSSDQLH